MPGLLPPAPGAMVEPPGGVRGRVRGKWLAPGRCLKAGLVQEVSLRGRLVAWEGTNGNGIRGRTLRRGDGETEKKDVWFGEEIKA